MSIFKNKRKMQVYNDLLHYAVEKQFQNLVRKHNLTAGEAFLKLHEILQITESEQVLIAQDVNSKRKALFS